MISRAYDISRRRSSPQALLIEQLQCFPIQQFPRRLFFMQQAARELLDRETLELLDKESLRRRTASRDIAIIMSKANSMKKQLNETREQSRRLEAQLQEAEQASREDRAQLEECQSNKIAMSERQQETEREFVALEAKARDAVQQRDMLIKQEAAALQESLNDTEAHLDNALKEKAELQEKLKARAKELENALRENMETVSYCAEARKGLERLLRGSEAREADLSAKLDLEKAKREELQAEQSSLKVADALQRQNRSQVMESKDLEIKVRGRVPQRRFWLLSVCLWNKRPPNCFPCSDTAASSTPLLGAAEAREAGGCSGGNEGGAV